MTSVDLSEHEQRLVDFLRRETQSHAQLHHLSDSRYSCTAELFLDRGRFFTPASGATKAAKCRSDGDEASAPSARDLSSGLLYVEGWAWGTRRPTLRSWSATTDAFAQEVTCRRDALAYLGLPLRAEAMVKLVVQQNVPLLYGDGMLTPTALQWLRNGVPDGVLADVGRPVPRSTENLCA
ncbi:hypothetical protein [Streptomyces sp. AK02-04a]|uniref:hypothetical protein n=1 Tax=Streptomyces sp. AK02-04a TaxID=3028649 RepID=UPI0029AF8C0B|nr:hypothetical protein [Streptomyces sp. AK02-04a]MDX3763411.1 hypothetical protein [Streptomyces sp. AK02-04a]